MHIGAGSFAIVWRARHLDTGAEAAIKEINLAKLNAKLRQSLESEVSILKRVRHENIVTLLEVIEVRPARPPAPAAPCPHLSPLGQARVFGRSCVLCTRRGSALVRSGPLRGASSAGGLVFNGCSHAGSHAAVRGASGANSSGYSSAGRAVTVRQRYGFPALPCCPCACRRRAVCSWSWSTAPAATSPTSCAA